MGYIKIKNGSTTKQYTLTNAHAKPYLRVSNSYLPLTEATTAGFKLRVKSGTKSYRAMEYLSSSSSTTYHTTAANQAGLSSVTALTRSYTTATAPLTCESTSDTLYGTQSVAAGGIYYEFIREQYTSGNFSASGQWYYSTQTIYYIPGAMKASSTDYNNEWDHNTTNLSITFTRGQAPIAYTTKQYVMNYTYLTESSTTVEATGEINATSLSTQIGFYSNGYYYYDSTYTGCGRGAYHYIYKRQSTSAQTTGTTYLTRESTSGTTYLSTKSTSGYSGVSSSSTSVMAWQ